jgi:hypothetical protein
MPFIAYAQAGNPDAYKLAGTQEVQLGKNIVNAAMQTLDTLQHFIFSSLPSPDTISNHKYPHLNHFEGKVEIENYIRKHGEYRPSGKRLWDSYRMEETLSHSAGKRLSEITTVVWCGYYMENFARWTLNSYLRPRSVRSRLVFRRTCN